MNLTLRQLRIFEAVARLLNFTRASGPASARSIRM